MYREAAKDALFLRLFAARNSMYVALKYSSFNQFDLVGHIASVIFDFTLRFHFFPSGSTS